MSPEKQRIAIAEACGYRQPGDDEEAVEKGWWYKPPGDNSCSLATGLPNYLNDLNAMHEAEKVLTFSKRQGYYRKLQRVCSAGLLKGLIVVMETCIHATADQRAEAFLRELGKWEE